MVITPQSNMHVPNDFIATLYSILSSEGSECGIIDAATYYSFGNPRETPNLDAVVDVSGSEVRVSDSCKYSLY